MIGSLKSSIDSGTVEFEHIREKAPGNENELSILDAALSRVAVKEVRIRDAYEAGIDTLEEYKENKKRIANERQEILDEIDRLKALTAAVPDDTPSQEEILRRVKDVYALVSDPSVSYEVKGSAVRSIISEIIVDQEKKEIYFHYYA